MCTWCEKDAPLEPQVSGAKIPMICTECGTRVCAYGWQELRAVFNQYEKRIKILETALERVS